MANRPNAEPLNDIKIKILRPNTSAIVAVVNDPRIRAIASRISDTYGSNTDELARLKMIAA